MTPTVNETGNLRITTYENGQEFVILTACPFCGYNFDDHEERSDHFHDHHTPGDAGLTPYTKHEKQTTIGDYNAELVTDGGTTFTFHHATDCDECGRENAGSRVPDGRALCGECALNEIER